MKNFLLAFLTVSVLIAFSSCSMEKRLYRNGWYTDHTTLLNKKNESVELPAQAKTEATRNKIQSAPEIVSSNASAQMETTDVIAVPENSKAGKAIHSGPIKEVIGQIRQKYTRGLNDPNRMTYSQAKKQMAEKGCTANSMAMATYYMAWISVFSTLLLGFGVILCLATLILSIFAINSVVKSGSCVDENLAVIAAAKRICFIELIWFAIAAILTALIVLAFIALLSNSRII
jgi:hypothetical protein